MKLNTTVRKKTRAILDSLHIIPQQNINKEQAAVSYSEKILFAVFSRDQIIGERPYRLSYVDGYWLIIGSIPKGSFGGAFQIAFDRKTGEIAFIAHPK